MTEVFWFPLQSSSLREKSDPAVRAPRLRTDTWRRSVGGSVCIQPEDPRLAFRDIRHASQCQGRPRPALESPGAAPRLLRSRAAGTEPSDESCFLDRALTETAELPFLQTPGSSARSSECGTRERRPVFRGLERRPCREDW